MNIIEPSRTTPNREQPPEPASATFTHQLLNWFAQNDRPLPWKGEPDPYLIWLSEIILQQTRVQQGLPYYERFRERYPAVKDLADAPEDEVMKMWEGLGYYSRARNLHATAKRIAYEMDGRFPDTYEGIRSLKGVGEYTAAAIASFAYGLPHAVVDGNVYRVLSRVFGIATPIDTTAGKKEFRALADELLPEDRPAEYNQAIMDFGATHCTPARPKCGQCPMQSFCVAYQEGRIAALPVKEKKLKKRDRFFHYLVLRQNGKLAIRRRGPGDVWEQLYEFPLLEATELRNRTELSTDPQLEELLGMQPEIVTVSQTFRQVLSHQRIHAKFFGIDLPGGLQLPTNDWLFVPKTALKNYAFPKLITRYLGENSVSLELF